MGWIKKKRNIYSIVVVFMLLTCFGSAFADRGLQGLENQIDGTEQYDLLRLVNKTMGLPDGYVPPNLVKLKLPSAYPMELREEAAIPLKHMFSDANKEGISLRLASAYRSYSHQNNNYNRSLTNKGTAHTENYIAKPGHSEHQTGLAVDVAPPGYELTEKVADTVAGKWLAENAHRYGFILRYPKGKEDITGYNFEPWHFRYVGVEDATAIFEQDITFEEYYFGLFDTVKVAEVDLSPNKEIPKVELEKQAKQLVTVKYVQLLMGMSKLQRF